MFYFFGVFADSNVTSIQHGIQHAKNTAPVTENRIQCNNKNCLMFSKTGQQEQKQDNLLQHFQGEGCLRYWERFGVGVSLCLENHEHVCVWSKERDRIVIL